MKKLMDDVLVIGNWINSCKSYPQLQTIESFYQTVVSKEFYPNANRDSIADSLDHLSKLTTLQDQKIQGKNMKITTSRISAKFFRKEPYGRNHQRYGYLAQVNEGEDDEVMRMLLVKKVRDWHQSNGGRILNAPNGVIKVAEQEQRAISRQTPELGIRLAEERISIAIENAVTLDQLEALKPTLPMSLQKIYEKRLNELQPK